jgi:serine/threonine-protein kinase
MADAPLTPDRLAQLQAAFEFVIEHDAAEVTRYLTALAESDPDLARRVEALRDAHLRTGQQLDSPVSVDPATVAPIDHWVGQRVGAYDIERLIGAGGMGAVYAGVRADDQYQKQVAIKVVGARASGDLAVGRFRRERQILASLTHPNIASLLDGGVATGGQPYFVMEYIEGESITDWCDRRQLPVPARLALFRQVCQAVQFAHQNLVVHRDIKPGNILVTTDGVVKLLDFGIAKLLPNTGELSLDDDGDATLTRAGGRAFTPDYASPEEWRGQPIGTRSDVYALGIVLYELLVGTRPFELRGKPDLEMARMVCQDAPTRPSSALRDDHVPHLGERSADRARTRLRGDLDAIVLKALRKEPERRYGSVEELAADVQRVLDNQPVLARPDSVGYRFGKLLRRRRVESAAVVLVLLSIVAGVVASARQTRLAKAASVRADAERDRATEVTKFLTTMLGAASPGVFGRDIKVREVLDSAAARANKLRAQPALDAEIRSVIGGTYLALGEFERAEAQYRGELEAHARREPAGDQVTATALSRLAMSLEFQGRYAAADSLLHRASAIYDRLGFPDTSTWADHLDNRGRMLNHLGRNAEAVPIFRQALDLQLQRRPVQDSSVANAYANLAIMQSDLGNNAQAETLMLAAVAAARRAYGPVHPLVAAILSPLASIQERAGANDRADSTFRETLAMRRTLLGPEHPDYAWTMFNYADHLLSVGRLAECALWARRVLALRGRSLTDAHPAVSTAMTLLGRALSRMDSLDAAEPFLREGLALRKANFPAGHYLISASESALGEHLVRRGQFVQAEQLLLRSERELVASRGEQAPIIRDARQRLVMLYTAWKKPASADAWRARLAPR